MWVHPTKIGHPLSCSCVAEHVVIHIVQELKTGIIVMPLNSHPKNGQSLVQHRYPETKRELSLCTEISLTFQKHNVFTLCTVCYLWVEPQSGE